MLKFLEQRWEMLGARIAARNAVNELRELDEQHMVENFFQSPAWKKAVEISMNRLVLIKGSLDGLGVFLDKGVLQHLEEGLGGASHKTLTAENFHYFLTHPNIRLYRGSVTSVLRKFIGDVEVALLRLAH